MASILLPSWSLRQPLSTGLWSGWHREKYRMLNNFIIICNIAGTLTSVSRIQIPAREGTQGIFSSSSRISLHITQHVGHLRCMSQPHVGYLSGMTPFPCGQPQHSSSIVVRGVGNCPKSMPRSLLSASHQFPICTSFFFSFPVEVQIFFLICAPFG